MRSIFWISIFCLCFGIGQAQNGKNPSLSVANFSHGFLEQGARIGYGFTLKELAVPEGKDKIKTMRLQPQVGFFAKRYNHVAFLVNADWSIRHQRTDKKRYFSYGLGLGYLGSSDVTGFTVNFSGEVVEKQRTLNSYILPSIHGAWGINVNERWGFFLKSIYGVRLSPNAPRSGMLFFEAGFNINLNQNN